MKANTSKKVISKDMIFYLPAKILEGIVGFVTIGVYSRLFTTEVYGEYGGINPTINITFLIVLGWLMHSLYRYINTYKDNNNTEELCSTAFVSYITITGIFLIGIIIFILSGNKIISTTLLLSAFLMFVAYGLNQVLLNLLVALKKIKLNLILSLCGVVLKLVLTILLAFNFDRSVEILFIANGTVDLVKAIIVFVNLKGYRYIDFNKASMNTLKVMLRYGFPLIGLSLTMFVLNISDRYVIIYFCGSDVNGIYTANYSLASAVYTMMMMGIMRAVYPNLLDSWGKKDINRTKDILSSGVRYYLLICVPATVGLVVLSEPISRLCLSGEYQMGYSIIALTSIGMLFFGLSEYCNKAWELTINTKTILRNSLISGIINLVLNIILIPAYGYKIAAITTMLSFIIYFILCYTGAKKILIWKLKPVVYIRIIGSALTFGVLLIIAGYFIEINAAILVLAIIVSIIIYGVLLILTGELTEEIVMLRKLIKHK
ncbi:polysaccharide biosynthesis protein [Vallitalea longa]|uniref:Polysaccharide biosynthesis protein n=1 Tax=Vallitalea longa TaxID=2936439 RepID=A0A9W5YD92_9FIRM|nr:oligosaccharide flippase family protein [Vallitalea longa]GKX30440.1 polysaccharide biosynthesis protein [Vallitalea longa]